MPSMKLYKLSSHTKYSKPMALPNQTGASNKPKTLSGGIPPSQASPQAAAAKCPNSRQRAAMCPWSSMKPAASPLASKRSK